MVKIRAFRAVEDFEACQRFIEGHKRVLKSVGVTEVTSAKNEWAYNPASFVILVESSDGEKVLGGARIHAVGGTQPLPIEEAVGEFDNKIYQLIESKQLNGTGELCGLWNSVEVSGMGIGSVFLIRSAVAIASQIGLQSLFALCSPYTTRMAGNYGFRPQREIGNNGTFYYPKMNLLATVVCMPDLEMLPDVDSFEKERIIGLRKVPVQTSVEVSKRADLATGKKEEILLEYNLFLPSANTREFKIAPQSSLNKLSLLKVKYAS
jgi:hypothetical protein